MSALLEEQERITNRVPAAPIVAEVRDYLRGQVDLSETTYPDGRKELGPLAVLAMRVDVDESTLRKILDGHSKTIDFDFADLLLCKMGRADVWWGRLSEVYASVVLTEGVKKMAPGRASGKKRCEAHGCTVEFLPGARTPWQRFCSNSCKTRAYWTRRREREGREMGPSKYLKWDKCPNGHERTPENVHIRAKGGIACKACGREKEAARYRNDPEYRQRRIEASRRAREAKRVARAA